MPDITTLSIPVPEPITSDHLHEVSGGCHARPAPAPAGPVQQTVYAPQIYAPQFFCMPQTAQVAPATPSGGSIDTSVYVGPASGAPSQATQTTTIG